VAGGYRLAWSEDVLTSHGIDGLYTSTLFRFEPAFFEKLGPAVELGRSFVCEEFQKDYAPLMLLWKGIAQCVLVRPSAPVLFGPVSISANYSEAALELIVQFMQQKRLRRDLAKYVAPRHPFRPRLNSTVNLPLLTSGLNDIEELSEPLADISAESHVPVLLRQYVRLGGRVIGFNVDRHFSNVLDGLLVVDLRETAPNVLGRYMGSDAARAFQSMHRQPAAGTVMQLVQ
jgi:putative hemolysin